jgi:hypothetical protein
MRTCIDRLISRAHVDSKSIRDEIDFVTGTLEQARVDGSISNDAFLDAGNIHGALTMIAEHIDLGIAQKEIHEMLQQQIYRAEKVEEKHPGLNRTIESRRE